MSDERSEDDIKANIEQQRVRLDHAHAAYTAMVEAERNATEAKNRAWDDYILARTALRLAVFSLDDRLLGRYASEIRQ